MTTPQLFSSSNINSMNSAGQMNVQLPYTGYIPTGTSQTPMSGFDTTTSYEQSRRQVSSVVVSEQIIGDIPESGGVKYIEIPVIEEVVKHIPRREVRENEIVVPRYEVEYVEKVVEVPQIQYIDRPVERIQYEEVVRHVPVKQVQEVPREVIKTIPKVEYRQVEKRVEVPGEIIEVPKPYAVPQTVYVKNFVDTQKPVVVAQTVCPVVTESQEVIDVDVFEYEPQVIPVDVHVAKPVASHLVAVGATQEMHQIVTVPAAQYNTLLRSMNAHLGQDIDQLPYLQEGHQVPFLAQHETPGTAVPAGHVSIHPSGSVSGAPLTAAQINTREATVANTTSSLYHGQQSYQQPMYRPIDAESARRGETASLHTASQVATVPAVYPPGASVKNRDGSSVKDVSQYKSASRYSFTRSQPTQQHKRRGCQC